MVSQFFNILKWFKVKFIFNYSELFNFGMKIRNKKIIKFICVRQLIKFYLEKCTSYKWSFTAFIRLMICTSLQLIYENDWLHAALSGKWLLGVALRIIWCGALCETKCPIPCIFYSFLRLIEAVGSVAIGMAHLTSTMHIVELRIWKNVAHPQWQRYQ